MTAAGMPTLVAEIAFATAPTATPTWVDVSPYVRGFSVTRGRQWELDTMTAGRMQLVLDNADRRFDPTYTAGPYFGTILPMRRVRLRATWNGITYPIYAGFADSWQQGWGADGKDATTTVMCVDGLSVMDMAKLNDTYAAALSGARLSEVLDDVGWTSGANWIVGTSQLDTDTIVGPAGDRAIDAGQTTIQASTLANENALSHIGVVVASEQGLVYIAADGTFTFHGREALIRLVTTSTDTWGDGGIAAGELPYTDLQVAYDSTRVFNDIRLTRVGGSTQIAGGANTEYFLRSYSRTDLLNSSDLEVNDMANFLFNRFANPAQRVARMVIKPRKLASSLWPAVLARELGDRVTVVRRPPGGGSVLSQNSVIEGIEHAGTPHDWTVAWRLSPADQLTYLILDDAAFGKVGTGRLAY